MVDGKVREFKTSVCGACLVTQMVKNLPARQETWLSPWVEKIPGEGNGNPLQYSCLENFMNRGACRSTVHGIAKGQARLSD